MDTASTHGVVPVPGPRYLHDALFFSSPDELAAATVPFVQAGLAAGDAVVVAASPATADVVRTIHERAHTIAAAAGCTSTRCRAISARDWRQTPSYVGSVLPYSPEGVEGVEGDGDGEAATAGAAVPITTVAARTAALRRTFMIGGCPSPCGEPGSTGGPPGGSAPCTSTVPRTGRLPVRASRSRTVWGSPAHRSGRRFTVAGQRRNCTGFPPYGCDTTWLLYSPVGKRLRAPCAATTAVFPRPQTATYVTGSLPVTASARPSFTSRRRCASASETAMFREP